MDHMKEQFANCTIKAPGDGMVVYGSSGRSDWGRRDTPIQAGANIRVRRHGNPAGMRLMVTHGNGFAADAYLPFWQQLTSI